MPSKCMPVLIRATPCRTTDYQMSTMPGARYEKALQEIQEAVRLEPRALTFRSNLMGAYTRLDRFDEAKAVAEKAFAQELDGPFLHGGLLWVAYIQDDQAAQEKEIQWLAGRPDEYQSLELPALNALVHGQRRKAKE